MDRIEMSKLIHHRKAESVSENVVEEERNISIEWLNGVVRLPHRALAKTAPGIAIFALAFALRQRRSIACMMVRSAIMANGAKK
jgi:hypothetical protein